MNWYKWLTPGLRVKRWILLLCAGIIVASLGILIAFDFHPSILSVEILYRFTKQYVSPFVSGIVLVLVGALCIIAGFRGVVKSITAAISPNGSKPLIDVIYQRRHLEQGPRVVAIGGGTGLPAVLRGVKEYTSNITAVVTVADDGGSSGRLRELGFLPPGDIRNCLVALSDVEEMMQQLFQYRFQGMGDALDGHCFGNLLIAAMSEITGDFDLAIKQTSKVLAIRGQVLPATLDDVTLCAELETGVTVRGQSQVGFAPAKIRRAFIEPAHPCALPEAIQAITEADIIVIGPGSLYSSVIPNLLVDDIREAVRASLAPKVYICNLMTQPNETLGFTNASDHLRALIQHVGGGVVDHVVVNDRRPSESVMRKYREEGAEYVAPDIEVLERLGVCVFADDLVVEEEYLRHNSTKLAEIVYHVIEEPRFLMKSRATRMAQPTRVAA